jgi:hypothetical protein
MDQKKDQFPAAPTHVAIAKDGYAVRRGATPPGCTITLEPDEYVEVVDTNKQKQVSKKKCTRCLVLHPDGQIQQVPMPYTMMPEMHLKWCDCPFPGSHFTCTALVRENKREVYHVQGISHRKEFKAPINDAYARRDPNSPLRNIRGPVMFLRYDESCEYFLDCDDRDERTLRLKVAQ